MTPPGTLELQSMRIDTLKAELDEVRAQRADLLEALEGVKAAPWDARCWMQADAALARTRGGGGAGNAPDYHEGESDTKWGMPPSGND